MINLLNSSSIKGHAPKIIETKFGFIINGVYHKKSNMVADMNTDSYICGNSKTMSLNRLAYCQILSSAAISYSSPMYTSDRIIEDSIDKDVYYILTDDNETVNDASSKRRITKIFETEDDFKIIMSSYPSNMVGNYSNLIEYVGQCEAYIYFIFEYAASNALNISTVRRINKKTLNVSEQSMTLTGSFAASSRTSIKKITETSDFIYFLRRKSSTLTEIVELDKLNSTAKVIKTFPAIAGELDRLMYAHDSIMESQTSGYILEIDPKANTTTARKISFAITEKDGKSVIDPANITSSSISIELKNPEIMTTPSNDLAGTNVGTLEFITEVNNKKYLNICYYNCCGLDIALASSSKSVVSTYYIDDVNGKLIYTGSCPLSNNISPCKSLVTSKDKKEIIGLSSVNTFINSFDPLEEVFVPNKYFNFVANSIGFDLDNSIWIQDSSNQVHKFNKDIPDAVNISFENDYIEYAGESISTNIFIEALDYKKNKIASNIILTIKGNAKFSNGLNVISVTTSELEKTTVPLIIIGSGGIIISSDLKQ